MDINRIFTPVSIKVKNNRHLNIKFVDTFAIETSIDYQVDFGDQLTEMTIRNLESIENKIKTGANNG